MVYEGGWKLAGAKEPLFRPRTQLNDALIESCTADFI